LEYLFKKPKNTSHKEIIIFWFIFMRRAGFTPLHPESPGLQAGDEWQIKFESMIKLRPLGRGVTGFTFIELMISIVILYFGLCVILNSFIGAIRALNAGQNYVESASLAREKIEEMEIASYENKGLAIDTQSGSFTSRGRNFSWRSETTEISDRSEDHDLVSDSQSHSPELAKEMLLVKVSLNWKERGIPKSSSIVTYLPKIKEEIKAQ